MESSLHQTYHAFLQALLDRIPPDRRPRVADLVGLIALTTAADHYTDDDLEDACAVILMYRAFFNSVHHAHNAHNEEDAHAQKSSSQVTH